MPLPIHLQKRKWESISGLFGYEPAESVHPLPIWDHQLPSPIADDQASKAMPRYSVPNGTTIGSKSIQANQSFAFLGWPPGHFRPENAVAERVKAYYAANKDDPNPNAHEKDNPDLLPSPWCLKHQALVLPELPDRKAEREKERAETLRALRASGYNVVAMGN